MESALKEANSGLRKEIEAQCSEKEALRTQCEKARVDIAELIAQSGRLFTELVGRAVA